ncbi:MAG: glycosyltransferase involved in cell wall biosynthesis [Gammaproteobacteria bacterium]|jgi:glycosyltransferase involved in cell wall biosynthesis
MTTRPLNILQVATADLAGGAERSARNLCEQFALDGHASWLAVGHRHTNDADAQVSQIANATNRNRLVRSCDRLIARADCAPSTIRGLGRAARALRKVAEPGRWLSNRLGREDFDFPGTRTLLQLPPWPADIVHCHNLHGGYFDLRELPQLSTRVPTVLNVRDAWLLSGHCAYGLGCERWRSGCGECPDLSIYPAITRDATAFNWQRKSDIYARSRLYVTAPSQWLLDMVHQSMLAPAIVEARVIPNGVDVSVFKPAPQQVARKLLNIDPQAMVVMVAAKAICSNPWKDYATLRRTLELLGAQWRGAQLQVLAVGEEGAQEQIGNVQLRFVPFVSEVAQLAHYYQASDVYLHAARVESFGNVLLEAKACGVPIVTTAVGGIVEHVYGMHCPWSLPGLATLPREEAVGVLTAPGDADALAGATLMLLADRDLRECLSRAAVAHALEHGTLQLQASRFVDWYRHILGHTVAVPAP